MEKVQELKKGTLFLSLSLDNFFFLERLFKLRTDTFLNLIDGDDSGSCLKYAQKLCVDTVKFYKNK